MTTPKESEKRTDRIDPYGAMTRVLMKAEDLSLEERKSVLRFDQEQVNPSGGHYVLLLEPQSSLCVRVAHSQERGVAFAAYEEAEWAYRIAGESIPLRTGYLQIDDKSIREIRPIGLILDTTLAVEEILSLHFPKHELIIQNIDARETGF